jgi:hypothetical protein
MKRKAQPIIEPTAKCVRCGGSIGKPRRSGPNPDGTRPWVRFCPKCVSQRQIDGHTPESYKITTAKVLAARMALSPEERSEIAKRGHASMSPEVKERRSKLISEATKRQTNFAKPTATHVARIVSMSTAARQAKLAAKIGKGFAECPHCQCTLPLDYFGVLRTALGETRTWYHCFACATIRHTFGRYPFILKRTGKLNLPVDFHGFRKSASKTIYEQYWLPKLDTGEEG